MNYKIISVLTFIFALSQLISPSFLNFQGFSTVNPLIIPANYTFAIWGLITLGCGVFGCYQLFFPKLAGKKFESINVFAIVLFALFTVWLYFAGLNQQWATVFVFVAMFAMLLKINTNLIKIKLTNLDKIIVQAPFLLYLGWTTIAIFANVTSAIAEQGLIFADERSVVTYIAILSLALGNAVWVGLKVNFNYYYVGTIIWAFVGIIVGSSLKGSITVPIVCLLAIATMIISTNYYQKTKIQ